ncbi:ATP-binding protein [Shewanella maritima]|uniref:sensor histidine kinase n=1 Tax=Shewanella maritima TaxID=2520507 RepID=UPI003735D83A
MKKTIKKHAGVTALLILGLLISLKVSYWYHIKTGTQSLAAEAEHQLNEVVLFIEDALYRYESTPKVIAENQQIIDLLNNPQNAEMIEHVNEYFLHLKRATQVSQIYLIDTAGMTIAASNAGEKNSFISQNYSFRPYFIQAMSGEQGSYYAVGASSDKRGFYYSSPVYHDASIVGVAVLKVDIGLIEDLSRRMALASDDEYLISDPDNIIFLSSIEHWRYLSLTPLSQAKRYAIKQAKRYSGRPIGELTLSPTFSSEQQDTPIVYTVTDVGKSQQYVQVHRTMPRAKWTVHVFTSLDSLNRNLISSLLLSSTLYAVFALTLLYGFERRKNLKHSQQAKAVLAKKVKLRTQELEHSNSELKRTQDELIQVAKVNVVGHFAANVNHELNQPLVALRNYAESTMQQLDRKKYAEARNNINIMIELTQKLTDIINGFKNFSRKSTNDVQAIDIKQCINDAIIIVTPELEKQHIKLDCQLPDDFCQAWGDNLKLQQTLVNILSNAIHAMEDSHRKQLLIKLTINKVLHLCIKDTGTGIKSSHMNKIFEPYYTTHDRQSSGLGLSIAKRIIESMDGDIRVENAPEGGAVFLITLPVHIHEKSPIT